MPKPLDISGQRFGRLVAIEPINSKPTRKWLCQCDCGSFHSATTNKLTSGHTTSCGCRLLDGSIRRTHGMKGTRVYDIWKGIRKRCTNTQCFAYKNYGGRGITVCKRWESFENFYKDMGEPPTPKHTIERIDNNGNYSPNNCCWATYTDQARNRRNNSLLTLEGVTLCISEWSEITNLSESVISRRKYLGWSDKDALCTKKLTTSGEAS